MSRGFALILACGASLFSFGVQASPIRFAPMQKAAPDIILVWDWCGLGFHRSPYGYCIRNGTLAVPPVVVAPSPVVVAPSPVVVAPSPVIVAPSPVVAPIVCPSGYYLGPYGRCLLY
jgi:PXPV repeat-containing protein